MTMRYGSVCSGIEAASVAWHPLGWEPAFFAEIEPFPNAVLAHHYPTVPNRGDFTQIGAEHGPIDVLVGGTPCQSFSVAGRRGGLDDPRGVLAFEYLRLAGRLRSRWLVFENVPGLLSSGGGRDFGAFLGALGELGYGWAYRVLDAQHFGVPQRRRRVFVVGHLGDWRRAAAVLFDPEGVRGDSAAGGEAGEGLAPCLSARTRGGGGLGTDFDCDGGLIAHALTGEGHDASEDGTGRGTPIVPVAYAIQERAVSENPDNGPQGSGVRADGLAYTLEARNKVQAVAFNLRGREGGAQAEVDPDGLAVQRAASGGSSRSYLAFSCKDAGADAGELAPTLRAMGHADSHPNAGGQVAALYYSHDYNQDRVYGIDGVSEAQTATRRPNHLIDSQVRRLTPRECERLQAFPDDYTLIPYRGKPAADGPRYKALGNSMCVNVVRWIGERIAAVDTLAPEDTP